ncbi:MAG: ribonuclease III [Firmicutes bacterium]|nr:ribonuclease III [Candidatus Fermentithermobacillaceae bacterium]
MTGDKMTSEMSRVLMEALGSLSEQLRTEALTHVSYANEREGKIPSNERLEFLGDAVVSLAVAYYLLKKYPSSPEGELTRMRASLVSGQALAAIALRAGLGDLLLLGRGEEMTGGRKRPKNLAGAFEAVIGAYFLQHGWDKARELVEKTVLSGEPREPLQDPKTALQEMVQARPGATLEYRVVNVEGPDHMPTFTTAVFIDGKEVSRATGSSKKESEENAAKEALARYRTGNVP